MPPQMMRQMPEMQPPMMPLPMSFHHLQHMRQMGHPEMQPMMPQTQQNMLVQQLQFRPQTHQIVPTFTQNLRQGEQFPAVPETHQLVPTLAQNFRQFPFPPQNLPQPAIPRRFERMNPTQFSHQEMRQMDDPMQQFDQMNQPSNPHHFVAMGNPMAEQMQFAPADAQYY